MRSSTLPILGSWTSPPTLVFNVTEDIDFSSGKISFTIVCTLYSKEKDIMSSSIRLVAMMALARVVSGAAPPAATGAAAVAAKKEAAEANVLNQDFYNYLFIICGSLVVAMIMWRTSTELVKYVRQLTSLNNDTQSYFVAPSEKFASFKKHLLYAPVFSKRHNREFQLSSAVNMGTLPTRLQLAFLIGYFGTNIAFCVVSINWDLAYADTLKQVRNRTGILSVVNMVSCTSSREVQYLLFCSRFLYSLWLVEITSSSTGSTSLSTPSTSFTDGLAVLWFSRLLPTR